MLLQCGSAEILLALPSPSLGVSSLDLGRQQIAGGPFSFRPAAAAQFLAVADAAAPADHREIAPAGPQGQACGLTGHG